MRRQLKTIIIYAAVTAVTVTGVMTAQAASVLKRASVVMGQDELGDITVKRIWVGGDDPVFLTEDYDRIWLDTNVNVTASSEVNSKGQITGKVKTPMKEIFRYLGGNYKEDGERVILELNGDTLEMTVGSRDVVFNGTKVEGAIPAGQEPEKVDVKNEMGDYNTYLKSSYKVVRLPFKEVFTYFQADIGNDTYVQSIFAMVPVMESRNHAPKLEWSADGYGNRYDTLKDGSMEYLETAAANLAALQNSDGGFYPLPDNTEMGQEDMKDKVGTLAGESTLDQGATVYALRYLAEYASKTGDLSYMDSLNKGIKYLTDNQHVTGGWQMSPTAPEGYRANLYLGEGGTIDVLTLLAELAKGDEFAPLEIDRDGINSAIDKGTRFITDTQLTYHTGLQTKNGGWARQYNSSLDVTMGRTYERECMDTGVTARAARYLMGITNPSDVVVKAVESSVKWLGNVKIEDQETVKIWDTSVQNGYDIFLTEGDGTWPVSVEYQNGKARTVLADVDPKRPNQPKLNDENAKTSDNLILYATRTSVDYYINDLADSLIDDE